MTTDFRSKHVVMTGGDGGLGAAVSRALVGAGAVCHLPIVGAIDPGRIPVGVDATPHIDLADGGAVRRYYASLPPIAASIHLAGGFFFGAITETTDAQVDQQLTINFRTAFNCCREAVRVMRATSGGRTPTEAAGGGVGKGGAIATAPYARIVNVAARVVEVPGANLSAYTAAKGAVAGLTRALAAEVLGDGILVNAVLPSIIDTPANRAAMPKADHRRWPTAEQVAAAILWLASGDNMLTTGTLLPVYGSG